MKTTTDINSTHIVKVHYKDDPYTAGANGKTEIATETHKPVSLGDAIDIANRIDHSPIVDYTEVIHVNDHTFDMYCTALLGERFNVSVTWEGKAGSPFRVTRFNRSILWKIMDANYRGLNVVIDGEQSDGLDRIKRLLENPVPAWVNTHNLLEYMRGHLNPVT